MTGNPRHRFWHLPLFVVLGLGALFQGCGEGSTESSEWTVEEGTLTLEQDLLVGNDEDFYFGGIYSMAARDDGRVYVADGEAGHLKVIGPDGTLQDTIGRQGEGPGEFQGGPFRLTLVQDDSLYVGDQVGRISVFSPSGAFESAFSSRGAPDLPRFMMSQRGGGVVFAYYPLPTQVSESGSNVAVRPVNSNGEVGDTLFTARSYQTVSPAKYSVPFLRVSLFAQRPQENIYYVWSDSLSVRVYDQNGTRKRSVDVPFEPVPVTDEVQKAILSDRSSDERAFVKSHLSDTKPAVEHFLVDDEGRYWFGRPTIRSDSTDWWVTDPDEKRVVTATLPSNVELMSVKDGRAYGQKTTAETAPMLVRYRVHVRQ